MYNETGIQTKEFGKIVQWVKVEWALRAYLERRRYVSITNEKFVTKKNDEPAVSI